MSRYEKSQRLLQQALTSIPLGTQTFSKSYKHYPKGISPHFISHSKGAYAYDVDGNAYIDLVNSLAAITLGYANDEINQAVREQLEKGTIFSLPSEKEIELSELLVDTIPSAQMVRFGKNSSDATSAAVRVSRAYTQRDRVAVCGYHGWHDWYIGSTDKNLGVPKAVSQLTSMFQYNNIDSLHEVLNAYPNEFAAVILEPMNCEFPQDGFLEKVQALARQHGAVLIFDETVTGFRLDIGGAQSLFNVTPDLSCFGKGLANGFPISALVGKSDIMKLFDDVFYSFTYGGELLSIVAAIKAIEILKRDQVLDSLEKNGQTLKTGIEAMLFRLDLHDIFSISGHPSWTFMNVNDTPRVDSFTLKTLFLQECFENGILTLGTNNLSSSCDQLIIEQVLQRYESVFTTVKDALQTGTIEQRIKGEVLEPLFKVRH